MRFQRIFVSTADRHTARPQIQFNVKYIFLDPHPRTKIQRVGTTDGERRRSEDSGIKGLRDWVHVYVRAEWVAVGVRRALASAECGFDVRKRQERKGADRQCRRGESKDRGSEGTRTRTGVGEGGGTATARPPSERATERGGEAATKGRKAVYILLTPLREWRVGTPRLPSPSVDCDSVEDEPVLLQMQ